MVGERIEYSIQAVDETQEAADSIDSRFGRVFSGLAGAAAAVGAALLTGIEEAVETSQQELRRLRIATGRVSDEEQALLQGLADEGFLPEAGIEGLSALQGTRSQLGIVSEQDETLRVLAALQQAGTDPTQAAQAAVGFGLRGDQNVAAQLDIAFGVGAAQGVDADTIFAGLRNYGPVLNALGLNFLESASFIADLAQQGIEVSRVSPALNRFIRDASAEGVSPLQAAQGAVAQLRGASAVEASAIGQELFGAEGGLRLTQAIRSGQVGFGEELELDLPDDAASILALSSLTNREAFEAVIARNRLSGNFINQGIAGAGSLIGSLPFVGGAAAGGIGAIARQTEPGFDRSNELLQRQIELLERIANSSEQPSQLDFGQVSQDAGR